MGALATSARDFQQQNLGMESVQLVDAGLRLLSLLMKYSCWLRLAVTSSARWGSLQLSGKWL